MSYSRRVRNLCALVLSAATLAAVGTGPTVPPPEPMRTPVALVLTIDADEYRVGLGDRECDDICARLRNDFIDDARAALEKRYPFLNWRGNAVADTIVLRLTDDKLGLRRSFMRFEFRGPRAKPDEDAFESEFESRSTFQNRLDRLSWSPESLRVAWIKQLPATLDNPNLLPQVLGRVPLGIPVSRPMNRRMILAAPADSIGADEQGRPPGFELLVHVNYRSGLDRIKADGRLPLTNCNFAGAAVGYSCAYSKLILPSDEREGSRLDRLFAAQAFSNYRVRLTEFVPKRLTAPAQPGGTPAATAPALVPPPPQ